MKTHVALAALVLLVASVAFGPTAQAEEIPTRPEMRQVIQQDYIFQALWDGRLSWEDGKVLFAEQDALDRWLRRFADGHRMTVDEVRTLDYMFDISSRNIDKALRRQAAKRRMAGPTVVELALSSR